MFCTNWIKLDYCFQVQVWQEQVVFPEAEVLNKNLVK